MKDFTYCSPTRFVFGRGLVDQVGAELAAAGFRRILLVYGQSSVERSGALNRVRASLDVAGLSYVELGGVRPNPEVGLVREGISCARTHKADCVLALGGGSVIDCAKAIAFGVCYDGDVWDFFCGRATIERSLPVTCVLTIPAAGSEGSNSCVISNDERQAKNGVNSDLFRPRIAVMDPELTFSLPAYQTAAGVTDMIAHVCERFFSGVGSVPVTDEIACGLIAAIIEAAQRVKENPCDYDARANLMWAGTLAHNDLAGCGRSLSPTARAGGWESHALEHAMSAFDTQIAHGAGLAVIMPAWMRFVWREDPARFLRFGEAIFGIEPVDESEEAVCDAVEATIDELQGFFASLGMPTTMGELGLTEADVNVLCDIVIAAKGEVFGGMKQLGREEVKAIYRLAM